jgi:hypothetical protein
MILRRGGGGFFAGPRIRIHKDADIIGRAFL